MANPWAPEVGTPEWWALRLLRQLQDRLPALQQWDNYYQGNQPLAFASQKFREAFGERFPAFSSNFCQLVVDGTAERLEVQGFRFGSEEANALAWRIWQENDMDASSQMAHQEALIKGRSYGLVEPVPGGGVPTITIEDACDAIVEADPKVRNGRRAALKRWVDDSGKLVLYVYLPDGVYKYQTQLKWSDDHRKWWQAPGTWDVGYEWQLWSAAKFERYEVPGEPWPLPNALGVVPMVELPNRPRLRLGGQSEIAAIRSNQDALNKYRCDALIASEFAAFPQRYLLNFEPETDPDTGKAKEPFRSAIDRLWTVPPPDPDDPNAQYNQPSFGQFAAASLEPYQTMIALEVGHISAISQLPVHELLRTAASVPPSGEAIKSSESGLTRKIGRAELYLGEGWEELERVALKAMGSSAAEYRGAETVWTDSETRNEAVRTDAVVKLHAEGIIDDQLAQELAGLSRHQIDDLKARRDAAAKLEAANPPPAAEPAGAPLTVVPAPMGPRMGAPTPAAATGA